ncbi:uncharacterized protein MONOS_9673p1 [Monocercomonoides exilis]|uniref:uncharacterized protein n=1 Tax=Monocercomonoides exilis TaxID=2049356 RepID=UPI00355A87AF|nr:hypothetical protein MONOS_9673p1 [Monocercomonoides exilis]
MEEPPTQAYLIFEFPVVYGIGGSAILPPVICSICTMILFFLLIVDEIKSQGKKMNKMKFFYYASAFLFNFYFAFVHIVPLPVGLPLQYLILCHIMEHFHYLSSEFLETYLAKGALIPFSSSKRCSSIIIYVHFVIVFLILISSFICCVADPLSYSTWEAEGVLLILYDALLMLPLPIFVINLCRSVYKMSKRFIINSNFLLRVKMLVTLLLTMLVISLTCLVVEVYEAIAKQTIITEEEWNDCLFDETLCWKALLRVAGAGILRFILLDFSFSILFTYLTFSRFRATFISISNDKQTGKGYSGQVPGIKYEMSPNSELAKPLHPNLAS